MQQNIFELTRERFKFDKDTPIKVFESFSGVGMQLLALNRLGVKYESVGYSEIDKYAINSYKAIHGNGNNYGDICKIKGIELPKIDLFTYSFPCTDLSKAGQQKGLNNTRSGLVYEVLRIIQELKDKNSLPKVLLMENVVDLVQVKFIKQFNEIHAELEELGYSNYVQTLNAKDYGVAQNRDRVFMVSILGDYYYEFPKPVKLEKRLKDYLQPLEEIEDKYFITDYEKIFKINDFYSELKGGKWDKLHDIGKRVYSSGYISPTIHTMQGGNLEPKISYALGSREHQARGWLDESPTLCARDYKDPKVILQPVEPLCLNSKVNGKQPKVINNHNIRKLTPLECWRLMGIDDKDYYKAEAVCSNSQLYKQAGNGIVVDVLVAIFKKLY